MEAYGNSARINLSQNTQELIGPLVNQKKVLGVAELHDPRMAKALNFLAKKSIIKRVIAFTRPENQASTESQVSSHGLEGFVEWNPDLSSHARETIEIGLQRKNRPPLPPTDMENLVGSPLILAATCLKYRQSDAVVAGISYPTAEIVKAGLKIVGLADPFNIVSGSTLLVKGDSNQLAIPNRILFADSGVVIQPDRDQLCEIAYQSALTWQRVAKEPARVAFLSFSTKGSADHKMVEFMRDTYQLFNKTHPNIACDGELQFDAALDPDIGQKKSPNSPVAGKANVFIFPDLNSGNLAYKIAQRLGGYTAVGPLLQGLNFPFSDLSRGSTVEDIIATACVNLM